MQLNEVVEVVRGFCSRACRRKRHCEIIRDSKRRRRIKKCGIYQEPYKSLDIFIRDDWKCWICGGKCLRKTKVPHPKAATIDHVIPLENGGIDAPSNVQCAHFKCNVEKGTSVITLW